MLHRLQFEINSNCIEKVFVKLVVSVAEEKARFTDATVSDDQHLEEIVTVDENHE